jgi:hypothetical protein
MFRKIHFPETFTYMYGRAPYNAKVVMSEGKNVSVSFRVSPRFKCLLAAAAARERRSQTNMLETLLFAYCDEHGLQAVPSEESENKTPAGGFSK